MSLNSDTLKKYDITELYNYLSSNVDNVFKKYNYLDIASNELKKIGLSAIKNTIKFYNNNESVEIFFEKMLTKEFNNFIKNKLMDKNACILIINNYINKNIKMPTNYVESMSSLKKTVNFLVKYQYQFIPDYTIDLINSNTILSSSLKNIVDNNIELIKNNKINTKFKNVNITSLIEIYCMLNNINIENKEISTYINNIDDDYILGDIKEIYYNDIGKYDVLTIEEEKELFYRFLNGDIEAKNKIIEHNLKLVINIAGGYYRGDNNFLDIIQEGNTGLTLAVSKFDITKGYKFSTYATHWIKHKIREYFLNKDRNIKIPAYLNRQVFTFRKISNDLEVILNRKPTINEIADKMEISVERAEKLYKLQLDTISFNQIISEDGETELSEYLPSDSETLDDVVIHKMLTDDVRELLNNCNLKKREIDVLMYRYGLNGYTKTLKEIASLFGLTRERIRQIEAEAIRKIRQSSIIKNYANYMEDSEVALQKIKIFKNLYKNSNNKYKTFLNILDN